MKPISTLLCALLTGMLLITACDENAVDSDNITPDPPKNIVGYPLDVDVGIAMVLLWTAPDSTPADGYNVYRKAGFNPYEKLNDELITPEPWGPDETCPNALYFGEFNSAAINEHTYYVTSVRGGKESAPSDSVSCDPSEVDYDNIIYDPSPIDDDTIALEPAFAWIQKDGAHSYLLFLYTHVSGGYRPEWVHRCEQNCDTFKTQSGYTFADNGEDLLDEGTEYYWRVFASDSNNCCFAFTNEMLEFMTRSTRRLVWDYVVPSGKYRVCWDQKDEEGVQVPHGTYLVRYWCNAGRDSLEIEVGDFPATQPPDCDIEPQEATQIVNLTASATQVPPGDTIAFDYEYQGRVCSMYIDII